MAHASINIRHTGSDRGSSKITKRLSGVYYQKCFICFVLFLFRLSPCQVRFTFLNDSQ